MKTVTLDIGTFEVLEELKRKQHESVSLARNLATGEKIILRSQEQEDQTYRLLSMIRHKNLVKVLCVQKDGEKLYVAEEYVQGRLLSDVVEKGLLPKGEVIRICLQLCDALEALHAAGIVHRAVKPENIFLLDDGTVKLFDYDAARVYKFYASGDTTIMGTMGYAAPEQYGLMQSDARSDIYALGILLNFLLTGSHPTVKLCRGRFRRIVVHCTYVTPERRYQTVAQLRSRLKIIGSKIDRVSIAVLALLLAAGLWAGIGMLPQPEEQTAETIASPTPSPTPVVTPPVVSVTPAPTAVPESAEPQATEKPVSAVQETPAESAEPVDLLAEEHGVPLAGRYTEILLNGKIKNSIHIIPVGVETVAAFYRGADNAGMTLEEAQKITAEVTARVGMNPWAELSCETLSMEGDTGKYQLKITTALENVTCYSLFRIGVEREGELIHEFKLQMDEMHFTCSKPVKVDGKDVRLSFTLIDMGRKREETSLSTWILESEDVEPDGYGTYPMMIGAFSGDTEDGVEEKWVYPYIEKIEFRQICNDANDVMYLWKTYEEYDGGSGRFGFDLKRSLDTGFVEIEATVYFVEELNMEPVVLTTRYTSHIM